MVSPILPGWAVLLAWGSFAVVCAVFLHAFEALPPMAGIGTRFAKALGLVFLIAGTFELFGAASGGQDALQPLGHIRVSDTPSASAKPETRFTRIRNVAELENTLRTSSTPVLLDFYADWCVACKEMERMTFNNGKVAEQLRQVKLLQVDVTANSEEDRQLMKRFSLFGPPGIILFNNAGKEVPKSRIIGYLEANAFLAHIKRHLAGFAG
jgi:thiol:disulfide interchange protein DsbD